MKAATLFQLTTAIALPTLALPGAAEASACGGDPNDFPYNCMKSDSWSDGGFGASYFAEAGLVTRMDLTRAVRGEWYEDAYQNIFDAAVPNDYVNAGVGFSARVEMFGNSLPLADVSLKAKHAESRLNTRVKVGIAGITLINLPPEILSRDLVYERELARAKKTIVFGVVPVTVRATANGEIGARLSAYTGAASVGIHGEPFIRAFATAGVTLGGGCAGLGVVGQLTLLELALPAEAGVSIHLPTATNPLRSVEFEAEARWSLSSFDGSIDLVGQACGHGINFTLTEWDGVVWAEDTLYEASHTVVF